MTIHLIISMHLFRVFDYKYNIEITFLFSVVTCWLAVTWAAVPKLEPAQLQAPTLSALGKAEWEPSFSNTNEFQNYSFKPKKKDHVVFSLSHHILLVLTQNTVDSIF